MSAETSPILPDDDHPLYRRTEARANARRSRAVALTIAFLATCAIAAAIYLYVYRGEERVAQPAQPPEAPMSPAPATSAPAAQSQYPLPVAASNDLPPLTASDSAVSDAIAQQLVSPALKQLLEHTDVVRRIVATVDAIPRRHVPMGLLPVKPPVGSFVANDSGNGATLDARNEQRYAPYVALAHEVDSKKLVAAYVRFYPLFQEQYRQLGYPQGNFNDRLVLAIDDLLATPNVDGPIALERPRILYQYADPGLESLSAGQKVLLRMGKANAYAVKQKLREIRAEIVAAGTRQ